MGIQDRFCPKCGRPTKEDGVCVHCRLAGTPWFSCEPRVRCIHCPSCGALKQVNTWTDTDRERSSHAQDLARSAVHFHPDLKKPYLDIKINDLSTNRSRAIITVEGMLYHEPVRGTCEVEIAWQKEQCDRCNRISGNYYEGMVQVRAQERIPSPYEVQIVAAIACEIEESLQTGGERLSFISDVNEIRDGLDIVVGSQHIGLLIARRITAELGGRYTTHPKLIGEKNGRQLFRITYSIRLPKYQKRDVIRFKKRYGEIIQVEPRHVRVLDLSDGAIRAVKEGEIEKIVGNARNAEDAMVAFFSGTTIGVIDPATWATRECMAGSGLDVRAGHHVRILRDGDQLVVLR
ncbi:MAG: 60S ribosomal export protein NMD3 [Methanoregula sp.]|jgi:nonsense-mediated mRNA decay protein 3|nr:60S ribosomal export protein NMD3 [Methanoregula sp.]